MWRRKTNQQPKRKTYEITRTSTRRIQCRIKIRRRSESTSGTPNRCRAGGGRSHIDSSAWFAACGKQDGEYRQSAHLVGHPETTLFLITPANPQGEVFLHGAFVPDDEEEEEKWAIENAKAAAERYLTDWVKIAITTIAANG